MNAKYAKPECFVLYGDWGKKIYDHIMSAKPRKEPLWTKADAEKFEKEAKVAFEEAAKAGVFEEELLHKNEEI